MSLTLDGADNDYEAVILDGDMLQSADRRLTTLDYLLWLQDDWGVRLRESVRIAPHIKRPHLLKVFPHHGRSWREQPAALVSVIDSELYLQNGEGTELTLCQRGVGSLARLAWRNPHRYWETAFGDGQLVVASPVVFGDALHASGPRLRTSALARA